MKSVPNIISTKDLSYIEDMLNWNFVCIKKINHYLDIIKDDDVFKTVLKIKEQLLVDYKNILNVLE